MPAGAMMLIAPGTTAPTNVICPLTGIAIDPAVFAAAAPPTALTHSTFVACGLEMSRYTCGRGANVIAADTLVAVPEQLDSVPGAACAPAETRTARIAAQKNLARTITIPSR